MPDRRDEIDYLRCKARQFRELASKCDGAGAPEMLEIAEALERHAEELEKRAVSQVTLSYRIYFRHRDLGIVGRDEFEAEDDRAALAFAEILCDACSDVCDHFELWQGARCVGACDRGECASLDAGQLNAQIQAALAEHEERLLDSTWAVAKSRRLLERLRAQPAP